VDPLEGFDRGDPALQDAASLLRCLIEAIAELPDALPAGIPNADAARERLRARIPALTGEPLLEAESLRRNVLHLLRRLASRTGPPGRIARELSDALTSSGAGVDWHALAAAAVAGEWEAVAADGGMAGVDSRALAEALEWAMRPALREGAARLRGVLHEIPWEAGRCPACGALPGLAELRPDAVEGARMLRCLRCATAWPYPRVGCPQCGERDHRRLAYIHGEGEFAHRRAQWCAACRFYVKEVATLDALDADRLLEVDLAMSALDHAAVSRALWR
jgi:FdhE protein